MAATDEALAMARVAVAAAADKKAQDVVVLDVSEQLVITDLFVIASAPNERQVQAIVEEVEEKMRLAGSKPTRREGAREGRWVLLDFVDVVVHVQHSEERGFYGLDRLWKDCPRVAFPEAEVETGGRRRVTLRRLVLLRHGQTDYNLQGRMQGHLDVELTEGGLAQAAVVAPGIAALGPDRLISSDLRRAVDTAAVVGAAAGLDVKVDPRLRETHLGQWQGRTVAEIEAEWPGAIAEWRSDAGWAPPGGESRIEVVRRARPVIDELDEEYADNPEGIVVVVAHGGMIAGLVCGLLGLPVSTWPSIGGMANCHWAALARRVRPSPLAALGLQRRRRGPACGPLTRRCRVRHCWSSPTRSPSTVPNAPSQPTTRGCGPTSRPRRSAVAPSWSQASAGRLATPGRR